LILRPACDNAQFMWPVIANRLPTPAVYIRETNITELEQISEVVSGNTAKECRMVSHRWITLCKREIRGRANDLFRFVAVFSRDTRTFKKKCAFQWLRGNLRHVPVVTSRS